MILSRRLLLLSQQQGRRGRRFICTNASALYKHFSNNKEARGVIDTALCDDKAEEDVAAAQFKLATLFYEKSRIGNTTTTTSTAILSKNKEDIRQAQRDSNNHLKTKAAIKKSIKASSIVQHNVDNRMALRLSPTYNVKNNISSILSNDLFEAIDWLQLIIKTNSLSSTNALVLLGNIAMKHSQEALGLKYYETASSDHSNPHPDALYNLGMCYYDGISSDNGFKVSPNKTKALSFFTQAASLNDPSALYFLGHYYYQNKTQDAKSYLEKATALNHPGATYYLALLYYNDTPQNYEKFIKYLEKAVILKDPNALYCKAGLESTSEKEAITLYQQAAEENHPESLLCLGTISYNQQEYDDAFKFYSQAANLGSLPAWKNLASMYLYGEGTAKSIKTAESILDMLEKQSTYADDDG